jgi:hypothetical protein
VEAETLRKEVSDKQDLLCQAAKALDLIEEQHRGELKKIEQERDLEKGMLESRILELEAVSEATFMKLELVKSHTSSQHSVPRWCLIVFCCFRINVVNV